MVFYLYAFISYLIPTTFFGPFYFLQDLEHTFQLVYFNVFQQSQNCETGNIYARVPIQYELIHSFITVFMRLKYVMPPTLKYAIKCQQIVNYLVNNNGMKFTNNTKLGMNSTLCRTSLS